MAGEVAAVRDGRESFRGHVGGGWGWWPPPPYLHGSRACAADLTDARQEVEYVARVPVHHPAVRHFEVDKAVPAAPAEAPIHACPLQHLVEALEDQGSHQADGCLPTHLQEKLQFDSAWTPCLSSNSLKSCDHCCEPSNLNCSSSYCDCHVSFMIPEVYCKIRCGGTRHVCAADVPMLQVECGAADHSAHEGRGSALFSSFSTLHAACRRVCSCGNVDLQILEMLEVFMRGLVATILTPLLLQYHCWRRPGTLCIANCMGFYVLQVIMSSCYTSSPLQAAVHAAFAVFLSLGLNRWRRVRASLKLFLRFSGEDICVLSSVMHPLDLQLNPSPQMCLPTRLLVEPLALRLVRLSEAPEEYNCRLFVFGFSPDLLAGSFVFFCLDNIVCR